MGLMVIDGRVFVSFSFVFSFSIYTQSLILDEIVSTLNQIYDIILYSLIVIHYKLFLIRGSGIMKYSNHDNEPSGIIHSVFLLVIQLLCILWLFKSNSLNVIVHIYYYKREQSQNYYCDYCWRCKRGE